MPYSIGLSDAVTFRDLLERLPVAAYSCDAGGLITYFNPRAAELWGRAPALNAEIDRYCGSFRLFATDGSVIRHEDCWMARALRERRSYENREIVIAREDGSRIIALAHANPFFDASGAVIGAINVLLDITDRKGFEVQLVAAEAAMKAADRTKTEFIANMSHEFRTPLNAILGFADALRDGHLGESPERRAEYLGHILAAGRILQRLVEDSLDIARIEAGEFSLNLEPTDLCRVVGESVALSRARGAEQRISIDAALPHQPIIVRADPCRLEQVLVNVICNAVKFSNPGGVVRVRLDETACRRGQGIRISIEDDGIGMGPEDLAIAQQPFGQVKRGGERRNEGVGLGLPLALRLVRLQGGSVDIDSTPGVGTSVRISLPIANDDSPQPRERVDAA